ncbi:MAG: hypothetical protein Q4P25_05585 [Tissierellia bacterium]|nr:hypothetical protein [Tissierellia bacterium]
MKVLICCKEKNSSCDLLNHKVKQAFQEEEITIDELDLVSVEEGTICGNQYDIVFVDEDETVKFDEGMGIDLVGVKPPYSITELRKALAERY